ncbi:unnamed protein product [Leptidea sinapis]|uniref:Uncharacterized protein n=1 Tax=Leptidea sinapis TaxID=189913 RepID=A0A5E4QF32_9NEOP|nr:unnamed protein product [Leptidea sinapis]
MRQHTPDNINTDIYSDPSPLYACGLLSGEAMKTLSIGEGYNSTMTTYVYSQAQATLLLVHNWIE